MTLRQTILKTFYPLMIKAGEWFGVKAKVETMKNGSEPAESFYDLEATANNGQLVSFKAFRGKKVLIVNTASDCGYTAQLNELEKLNKLYKDKLVIIGFPANDFKQQEKGSDAEIAAFCTVTFGVQFLIMKKSSVIRSAQQNPVYQWLTDKKKNGWNDREPEWNFSKYLVNEDGLLTHYFGPAVSPLSNAIRKMLNLSAGSKE